MTVSVVNSKNIPVASTENKRVFLELKIVCCNTERDFSKSQKMKKIEKNDQILKLFSHFLNLLHADFSVVSEISTFKPIYTFEIC